MNIKQKIIAATVAIGCTFTVAACNESPAAPVAKSYNFDYTSWETLGEQIVSAAPELTNYRCADDQCRYDMNSIAKEWLLSVSQANDGDNRDGSQKIAGEYVARFKEWTVGGGGDDARDAVDLASGFIVGGAQMLADGEDLPPNPTIR